MKTNQNHQPTPPESPQGNPGNNPQAQNPPPPPEMDFGPVIYAYTRKQALADGCQVDVSTVAKEAGFRIPVFMTDTVFNSYVKVPEGVQCQDEAGRLWDIIPSS